MNLYLNISGRNPSHTTLLNWVHKIGYYELTKYKEKADDWIIILDESIKIGQEKVLVIFGVREKDINFIRPLQFTDLEPLRIISHIHWNGELLKKYLEELQKEIGTIKYAIADRGGVITKGLRISEIKHIYDITHKIAKILEKLYKENEEYKKITQQMTLMRNQLQQSEIAHIIPPNQRFKSRYHNLKIISDWANRMLNYLEKSKNPGEKIKEHLSWLTEHKIFIKELSEINNVICEVEKEVKSKGLSEATIKRCIKLLKKSKSEKGKILQEELLRYFKEIQELLPKTSKIVCTSDIIESAFGKYKNYLSQNPMSGITNLVLSIAAFTSSLKGNDISEALEKTTLNDVKKWTEKNIGQTLLQKQRSILRFT